MDVDVDDEKRRARDEESGERVVSGAGGSAQGSAAAAAAAHGAVAETGVAQSAFSWHDLRYTVPIGAGKQRLLLDNVSGFVEPGKLTALMGESGAGKVSLFFLSVGLYMWWFGLSKTDSGMGWDVRLHF